MTKRIVDTGPRLKTIHDTGPKLPKVDPAQVADALGAEPCDVNLGGAFGPITLLAIRQEVYRRLQANGFKPSSDEADCSSQIQLSKKMWAKLAKLANEVAVPDFAPTPAQMIGIILSLSLRSMDDPESVGSSA
jgi:hypothetical protein